MYNFSAGPSILAKDVVLQAQKELVNFNNSGNSIMEASHRGKYYDAVHNETLRLFREVMNIPDNYEILFVQGGASTQFDAIPLNLLKTGKADYIITGHFSKNAYNFAKRYGDIRVVCSNQDKNFSYIPTFDKKMFHSDADYTYITSNNTVYGTRVSNFPDVDNLVCDMSSNILSERIDVNKFGVIFAGAQKNIGCAGVTVVIVRKDLLNQAMPICPTMLNWKLQAEKNSMYNTPPCFPIYIMGLTLKWLKNLGGVDAIEKINIEKSNMLYDYIDNSNFYKNNIKKSDRSRMNVTFCTPSADLDNEFCQNAEKNGIMYIKGFGNLGGMRASIYNAMPVDGVKHLIDYMEKFRKAHL